MASRRLQSLLASQPRTVRLLVAAGHAALHDNDPIRALALYRDAEKIGPVPPEVLYNQALLALNNGEHDHSAALLQQVLGSSVDVAPGRFYLGLFFESTEEFLCDAALYLARIHRDRGRLGPAREVFQQALSYSPNNVTALMALGELALLARNYIEATRFLDRILAGSSLEEDLINAHNNLAIAQYENGALDAAVEHLKWVLQRSPTNPVAIQNLHHIYDREGVFHERSTGGAVRFVDMPDGATPIFELSSQQVARDAGDVQAPRPIVGKSAEMARMMRHARVAASCDSAVLLRGETGAGKQLLAEKIAFNSDRRAGPFVVVECSGVPDLQLEAELFGHEKGAFTGARTRKAGAFEQAQGGTLFIEDVDALSPILQGKLYRALQERRFLPAGGTSTIPFDVRLIAATTLDLTEAMRTGSFRQDLFYLMNVIMIEVPPLRDRRDDIPLLVEHFLLKHARGGRAPARIPPEDMQVLLDHEWPGNVRELENLVERAIALGSQSSLFMEELARLRRRKEQDGRQSGSEELSVSYSLSTSLAELERQHILSVLDSVGHNQRAAARILGINPSTLWRKLKSYGLGTGSDEPKDA
ncbi:tetratricopeptide repeat protein [bacterium]|nr:tetratricopeptide repeat protein [bacterium]